MPHLAQSSPSRLGQQPIQRHNVGGRSAQFRDGELSHLRVQAPNQGVVGYLRPNLTPPPPRPRVVSFFKVE